jgi:peroxiredoxin
MSVRPWVLAASLLASVSVGARAARAEDPPVASQPASQRSTPEPLKLGEEAPSFSMRVSNPELASLKQFALARFVGATPDEPKSQVVLSFAASYCEPCKKELAELGALKPKLDKAGILLAVVVIDTEPDGVESMRKLIVDELKLPYPMLSDRFGVVAKRYRATALPFTVVIDKAGVLTWKSSGFQPGAIATLSSKLGI